MLPEFQAIWDGHDGRINVAKHRIELLKDTDKPIHSAHYRVGRKTSEFEKVKIDKMLAQKVVERAQSEWAPPIVFAPKQDGTLRFCVDYRRLNVLTKRDSYPIRSMGKCIDSFGEAAVFSTIDASSGYCQAELDERDRDKAAFTTHIMEYIGLSACSLYLRMPQHIPAHNGRHTCSCEMTICLSILG